MYRWCSAACRTTWPSGSCRSPIRSSCKPRMNPLRCAVASIRVHSRLLFLLLFLPAVPATPLAAQAGTARVDLLARLLAAEDARRYDEAVLQRGARSRDELVRRRSALAAGRIADARGGPLLTLLLNDPVPS